MAAFDIDRFMNASGRVDLSDIHWEDVPRWRLTPETLRVLRVFAGVESSTLLYAKALLGTRNALQEPFGPFIAAWVYEEEFHGRAFRQFISAYGDELPDAIERSNIFKNRSVGEVFDEVASRALDTLFPSDWPAVHMVWGAVQEYTTYSCYQALIERVRHPILSTICERIMKQELKHFAFYYQQADQRLQRRSAQRLTTAALKVAWTPVGDGMVPRSEVCHSVRFLLDGLDGDAISKIERKVRELPGLGWFDMFTKYARRYDLRKAPAAWFPAHEAQAAE